MPLELLLVLVVGGIAAIAALLHGLGKSAPVQLDADAARAAWARHYPDDRIDAVAVSADGRAALIDTDHGPGLVWSFGADTVARHLRDSEIRTGPAGMRVRFRDYAAPGVTLHLTPDERDTWQSRMKPQT